MNLQKKNQKYVNLFYHCNILTTLYIIGIICSSGVVWAASIYIDPTYEGTERGTFENPYNSWNDINSFSSSDDYRQKCGTTYTGTLTITASGTFDDHIIIGAYNPNGSHEDNGKEVFGKNCSGGLAKPIIRYASSGRKGNALYLKGGQYIDVNSLQLTTSQHGVMVSGDNNKVQYCYIFHTQYGVRTGLTNDLGDNTTIEYNYVDLDEATNESKDTQNCFSLQSTTDNNTVQYNHCTGYDHAGVFMTRSTGNTVQYNYIYGDASVGSEDNCLDINPNANGNTLRHNYCKNAGKGISLLGASSNEVYGNVFVCNGDNYPQAYQGCIQLDPCGSNNVQNNLIYNNTVYDTDNLIGHKGIMLYTHSSDDVGSSVSGNEFINNVILKIGGYCLAIADNAGTVGTNYFYNNSCYDFKANQYASVKGLKYYTQNDFNDRSDAKNNRGDDPGLMNPDSEELWPDSASDKVVGNGMVLSDRYNQLLVPYDTDFTASPPKIKTQSQLADWHIGAYALRSIKKMNPPPEEVSGFHVISKK